MLWSKLSTMKIVLFLFVSQVTAIALLVKTTRECWWTFQQLMDRQFFRVLIPLVVSCKEAHTQTVDWRVPVRLQYDKNNGYNNLWIFMTGSTDSEVNASVSQICALKHKTLSHVQTSHSKHQRDQMCKFAQSVSTLVQTDMYCHALSRRLLSDLLPM